MFEWVDRTYLRGYRSFAPRPSLVQPSPNGGSCEKMRGLLELEDMGSPGDPGDHDQCRSESHKFKCSQKQDVKARPTDVTDEVVTKVQSESAKVPRARGNISVRVPLKVLECWPEQYVHRTCPQCRPRRKLAMLPTAQTSSASGDLHEVTAGCDPDGDSLSPILRTACVWGLPTGSPN